MINPRLPKKGKKSTRLGAPPSTDATTPNLTTPEVKDQNLQIRTTADFRQRWDMAKVVNRWKTNEDMAKALLDHFEQNS